MGSDPSPGLGCAPRGAAVGRSQRRGPLPGARLTPGGCRPARRPRAAGSDRRRPRVPPERGRGGAGWARGDPGPAAPQGQLPPGARGAPVRPAGGAAGRPGRVRRGGQRSLGHRAFVH